MKGVGNSYLEISTAIPAAQAGSALKMVHRAMQGPDQI